MVYQEQVMEIVRKLGGYSLGRSDLVRRAMSRKSTKSWKRKEKISFNGIVNDDGNCRGPWMFKKWYIRGCSK